MLAGLLSILSVGCDAASADPFEISVRVVRPDGSPIAGLPVRVVAPGDPSPRSANAGQRLQTDANGRIVRRGEGRVKTRRISLDSIFFWHPASLLEVGLEMDLLGRSALYWIELDVVRDGVRGGMQTYVQDRAGAFAAALEFDSRTHTWRIPGSADGPHLTSPGAELKAHDVTGSRESGWRVELQMVKHEFTVR